MILAQAHLYREIHTIYKRTHARSHRHCPVFYTRIIVFLPFSPTADGSGTSKPRSHPGGLSPSPPSCSVKGQGVTTWLSSVTATSCIPGEMDVANVVGHTYVEYTRTF